MAQLCQHISEFQLANTRIILVSFGAPYQARVWQAETGACFTLLLDPERNAYRAFQLEHSMLCAWQPKIWLTYARLLLAGKKWRGIQGDSAQLGGDFIIDANGVIRYAHRSHDPTDRPTANELVRELAALNPA